MKRIKAHQEKNKNVSAYNIRFINSRKFILDPIESSQQSVSEVTVLLSEL